MSSHIDVAYDAQQGLTLTWEPAFGLPRVIVPLRVVLQGHGSFHVWGEGDADALAPAWAEKELTLCLFAPAEAQPGLTHTVAPFTTANGTLCFRAHARHARADVVLDISLRDECLAAELRVSCPATGNSVPLPLCTAELRFENLTVGPEAIFASAHHFGGGVHGVGKVSALAGRGHAFAHGCLGLAVPLVCLHHPATDRGIAAEFFSDGRPMAWLRPGRTPDQATWAITWETDRLLEPGQTHVYSGGLTLSPYHGDPVAQVRRWRDGAGERYGLTPPALPWWVRNANLIEYDLCQPAERATHGLLDLRRGDDPRFHACLQHWQTMGYNVLYLIAPNHTGAHSLSPLDYRPSAEIGGVEGEAALLHTAHALGYHVVLWVTTVGIDMQAPEVADHREWFVHKPDGTFYCPYGSYAGDADPLSTGWRQWLSTQVHGVIARGYDGIFIDGLTPRGSNHARWSWPGEVRNAVNAQVRDLAAQVRAQHADTMVFIEDESVAMQAASGFTLGRYSPSAPKLKQYWAGIGIPSAPEHPSHVRIAPEEVRDYLRMRYASLLPGVVSADMIEGYYSPYCLAWTAQSLLAGCTVKSFSTSITEPELFQEMHDNGEFPSEEERSPAHRRQGHEEFCALLRFAREEPLVRGMPVSIEGVVIEGDAAVVGLLHSFPKRCLLALIQFANRPALVRVRLAAPDDVPAITRVAVGEPQQQRWQTREVLRAQTAQTPLADGSIAGDTPLTIALAPYGYRVLELTR